MKDEPAFKSLQGNPAFLLVRESWCPIHLRQQTQDSSHIPIAERSSAWRACGKLAFLLIWSQGISSHLELIWGTRSSFMLLRWLQGPSRLLTVFLGTLWSSIKEIKASFVFYWKHGIALHAMQGNRASSCSVGEVSWFFSTCGGNLGYILELQRGWPFKTRICSTTSGLLSNWEGHLGILLKAWQGNRIPSRGESGHPVSLSSCHRDIVPINFQEESGIVSFWSIQLYVLLKLWKWCEFSCGDEAWNQGRIIGINSCYLLKEHHK